MQLVKFKSSAGLGASNIALNSIGGTINIITKPSENKKEAQLDIHSQIMEIQKLV